MTMVKIPHCMTKMHIVWNENTWNIGTMEQRCRRNEKMQEDKSKLHSVTVRLDEAILEKLTTIEKLRGINRSEAVRLCISEGKIIQVGNVKDFGTELYKIRMALVADESKDDVSKEVNKLCRSIYDLITKIEGQEE